MTKEAAAIGRERELAALADALVSARSEGRAGRCVVVGRPGIGKSVLLAALVEHLRRLGVPTGHASGLRAGRRIPLAAIQPLLGERSADHADDADRIAWALTHLGSPRRVIVVEDVHHLDDVSTVVLCHVARDGRAPLALSAPSMAALPPDLAALCSLPDVQRIDLGPLDRSGSDRLAEASREEPLAPAERERIWRLAAGDPMFTQALATSPTAPLTVGPPRGDPAWPVPARLSDWMVHRLVELGGAADVVLTLGAVGPLGLEVGDAAFGGPAIREACDAGLVQILGRFGRRAVDLTHPLHRILLAEVTSTAEVERLASTLTPALITTGSEHPDDVLALAAVHRILSTHDAGVAISAAEAALRRLDLDRAVAEAERARAAGADDRADTLLALADLRRRRARGNDSGPGRSSARLPEDRVTARARRELAATEMLPASVHSLVSGGRPLEAMAALERDGGELRWDDLAAAASLSIAEMLARWQLGTLPARRIPPPTDPWVDGRLAGAVNGAITGRRRASIRDEARDRRLPEHVVMLCTAIEAVAAAEHGDLPVAQEHVSVLDSSCDPAPAPVAWWVERARLWVCAADRRVDEAIERCRELASRQAEEAFHAVTSLHDLVRLGAADEALPPLTELAERPDATWWATACTAHAAAAADADGATLLEVAERFERGGLLVHAVEAAAHAAAVHASPRGRVRAIELVERLTAWSGPVVTPACEARLPRLSEREMTVARLAGAGLTNAQIAARLGTSSRTVGNQLQAAYQKLGVHSRAELRPLLSGDLPADRDAS